MFDYYLTACAAAMNAYSLAERHDRPDPPPTDVSVPDLGDLAAARVARRGLEAGLCVVP